MPSTEEDKPHERAAGLVPPSPKDMVARIHDYIVIEPKSPPSAVHKCGEARLNARVPRHGLKHEEIVRLTHACHELGAGKTASLTVSFFHQGRPAKPKGLLRMAAERGKLAPTRFELRSDHEHVTVNYTAPDETIKVSIRAFLDGFRRGKVHLHLE